METPEIIYIRRHLHDPLSLASRQSMLEEPSSSKFEHGVHWVDKRCEYLTAAHTADNSNEGSFRNPEGKVCQRERLLFLCCTGFVCFAGGFILRRPDWQQRQLVEGFLSFEKVPLAFPTPTRFHRRLQLLRTESAMPTRRRIQNGISITTLAVVSQVKAPSTSTPFMAL